MTTVGTADADPGELARGYLTVTDLPTGAPERVPVGVVEGSEGGPTLWVTAGVHGDEATGVAVAHDVLDCLDPGAVRGTVVVVPCLNPAGLRRNDRRSYYGDEDPNRGFPDPAGDRYEPPSVQELIDRRLYDRFSGANCLLDLHTATVGSVPFLIRDRVLYGDRRDREAAAALAEDLDGLAAAAGLPAVVEFGADGYTGRGLQRSTAGAVLNGAGVPALTFELGGHSVVERAGRRAGLAGVVGVAVHLGVLAEPPATVDPAATPRAPVDYRVRRSYGPRVGEPGLLDHRVDAGDAVASGDPLADVRSPTGERVETVTADRDGYVLGRREGLAVYENDPVCSLAVRDDGDPVVARESAGEGEPD